MADGDKIIACQFFKEVKVRGKRACPRCGEVRTVTTWMNKETGEDTFKPPLCGICDAVRSAEVHEQAARKMRARAAKMLARRHRRKEKQSK